MVTITKIYTRTGDDGSTGLVGGDRVQKDSARVEAYGDIDELNSLLGWARTISSPFLELASITEKLAVLQNELFDIGAELACAPGTELKGLKQLQEPQVARLEQWIDHLIDGLPPLKSFVLPGGSQLNAALHIARCVCRRSERNILKLSRVEKVSPIIIKYINRLSDLLFAMTRHEAHCLGHAEYLWEPGKSSM